MKHHGHCFVVRVYATVRIFNFEVLKFCGLPKHKEFVGLYFQGSAEIFISYAVIVSWFVSWIASNHEIHKNLSLLKLNTRTVYEQV